MVQPENVWPHSSASCFGDPIDQSASTYPVSGLNLAKIEIRASQASKGAGIKCHFPLLADGTPVDGQAISLPPPADPLRLAPSGDRRRPISFLCCGASATLGCRRPGPAWSSAEPAFGIVSKSSRSDEIQPGDGRSRPSAFASAALGDQLLPNSAMVMSSFSAIQAKDHLAIGVELLPPRLPSGLAEREPVSRARRTQTMAVAMPAPNRAAAERAENGSFNAASITRSRRS